MDNHRIEFDGSTSQVKKHSKNHQIMIRILNAEPKGYSPQAREILQGIGQLDEHELSRRELIDWLAPYDVLIVRLRHQVDRELLDAGSRLQAIVTATTGLDHIDLEYARQRGIAVLSLRGETEFLRTVPATAELTWGLLLALVRRIPQAIMRVCEGAWDRDALRGHDLYGQSLGIIGLGRIGEKVARYAQAFEMEVAAFDPYRTGWVDNVGRVETLTELMQQSRVLSIHTPLNDQTKGMIGVPELAQLPRGSILVNTARAAIIVEDALVAALESGHLAGAAVDGIDAERAADRRGTNPLVRYACTHSNLLITPHIGGATFESMAMTECFMASKLAQWVHNTIPDAVTTETQK